VKTPITIAPRYQAGNATPRQLIEGARKHPRGAFVSDRLQEIESNNVARFGTVPPEQPDPFDDDAPGGYYRRDSREHEAILEAVQARLDRNPDKMRERRQTVEHPFGTIKSLDGSHSLPDENAQARRHRNGPARPGLQHETSNAHSGRRRIDRGDPSIGAASADRSVMLGEGLDTASTQPTG
jgi:hypothetical protein